MTAKKYTRSIRLSEPMNERLTALCAHLGVTVNAYIMGELGKAISRDELAFKPPENKTAMLAALAEFIESEKGDQENA